MARSPLFSNLFRLLQVAEKANREKFSRNQLTDFLGTRREMSRRQFLMAGAAASLGISSAARAAEYLEDRPFRREITLRPLPVVIVGGGLAALTLAHRLKRRFEYRGRCAIFEASSRLGGRIFTEIGVHDDSQYADLGAEFIDSNHIALLSLCAELRVDVREFARGDAGLEPELYLAETDVRSEVEVTEAFRPLASFLTEDLKNAFPGGDRRVVTYFDHVSRRAFDLDQMSLADYFSRFNGKVEQWLLDLIANAYVGEFGLEAWEQSALNLLLMISPDTTSRLKMFGDSDEGRRIEGGSEELIKALRESIRDTCQIHLEHRLIAIRDRGVFIELIFATPVGEAVIQAQRVVLTLPFSALREVDGIHNLDLHPRKLAAIQELGYGTSAKMALGFKRPFWRLEDKPHPRNTGYIFTDTWVSSFWDMSRLQAGTSGLLTSFLGGNQGAMVGPAMVNKCLQALSYVYPDARKEFNRRFSFYNWAAEPLFNGCYACLKPGQYTRIFGKEREPELDGRLLFAGEHCSLNFQGFMNGSVESANEVADILLGRLVLRQQGIKERRG